MEPTFSLDNKLLSKSLADTLNSFNSQLDERGNIMDDLKKRRGESINIPLPPAPDPVPEPVTPPLPPTNETEDIVNIANVIKQIFSNIDVEQKKFDEAEAEAKRMAEAEAEAIRLKAEAEAEAIRLKAEAEEAAIRVIKLEQEMANTSLKSDITNMVQVVNVMMNIEENAKIQAEADKNTKASEAEAKRKADEEENARIQADKFQTNKAIEEAKIAEEDAKLAEEKQKIALLNQDIIDIAHVVSTIIDTAEKAENAENEDAKRKAEEEETRKKEEILNEAKRMAEELKKLSEEAKRKAEENANKIDITNIINVLQKVVGDITKDRVVDTVVDDVNKTDNNDIIQMLIAVVNQILTNPEPVQHDITKQKDIEQLIDILKQTLKNNVGDDALAQLMKYLLDNKDKLNITDENIENIKRVINGSSVPVLPWEETDEYKKMQLEMKEFQDIAQKSYEQSNTYIGDINDLTNKLTEVEKNANAMVEKAVIDKEKYENQINDLKKSNKDDLNAANNAIEQLQKDRVTARLENTPEAKKRLLQLERQLEEAKNNRQIINGAMWEGLEQANKNIEKAQQQATQAKQDLEKAQADAKQKIEKAEADAKQEIENAKASATSDLEKAKLQSQQVLITEQISARNEAKERLDQLVKEEKEAKQEYEKNIKSKQDIIDNLSALKGEVPHAQIENVIVEQELSNYNDIEKLIRELANSNEKIAVIQNYVTKAQDVEDATIRQHMIEILGDPNVNAAGAGNRLTEKQISEVTTIVKKKIGLKQKIKENELIIGKGSIQNKMKKTFFDSLSGLTKMVTPDEEKTMIDPADEECNRDPNYIGKIIIGDDTKRLYYNAEEKRIIVRKTCGEDNPDITMTSLSDSKLNDDTIN